MQAQAPQDRLQGFRNRNYLSLLAVQAGSTVEIGNLKVTDLITNKVAYQNDFHDGTTDGLRLFFSKESAPLPGLKGHDGKWIVDTSKTRVIDGRLRLECEGFNRYGAGAYESRALAILKTPLPRDSSIEFTAKKLQWSGHFNVLLLAGTASSFDPTFDLRVSGFQVAGASIFDPSERSILLHSRADFAKDVRVRLVERAGKLECYLNDELITAPNEASGTPAVAAPLAADKLNVAVAPPKPEPEPKPEPKLQPKEIAVDLGNGVKLEMILIPAGEFLMGSPDSDKDAGGDEKPQHRVRITKPFYLGKYLVTQEQWEAVMGTNPSHLNAPKNPVEQVSWDDCRQLLNRLNERLRRPHPGPLPEGEGDFQLPTEAQWEYACRAGSTTRYCFGDDEPGLSKYAWYNANSGGHTCPVGEKKPNAWNLYDMHGNVWQWCADWYDGSYYGKSPTDDPMGPAAGTDRVHRGGSWSDDAGYCRSAYRFFDGSGFRGPYLGLRVSRVPADK
jgi:formylglycine-generating enzyme required for sulfatase activity